MVRTAHATVRWTMCGADRRAFRSETLRRLLKERRKAKERHKRARDLRSHVAWQRAKGRVRLAMEKASRDRWTEYGGDSTVSTGGAVHRRVRQLIHPGSQLPPGMECGGETVTDQLRLANIVCSHFTCSGDARAVSMTQRSRLAGSETISLASVRDARALM